MTSDSLFALLTTLANVTLAIVAVCALCTARGHLKAARAGNSTAETARLESLLAAAENSRQQLTDSRARTRPYVSAQIVPGFHGDHSLDLRLTNTGNSTARNLTLTTDWPAQLDATTRKLQAMFSAPRDLAPQSSYRVTWRIQHDMQGPFEGMGIAGAVTMRYGSDDPGAQNYTDHLRFDYTTWGPVPLLSITTDGSGDPLKNLDLGVRALVENMAELRR